MNNSIRAVAFSLLAVLPFKAFPAGQQTKIPVITGLKYNKAREMLMAQGWQPAVTVSLNRKMESIQAELFRSAGYPEVNDCAGTGLSPCVFYFRDAYGKKLKVVTVGESDVKGDDFPRVDVYELVSELPTDDGPSPSEPEAPAMPVPEKTLEVKITRKQTEVGVKLMICAANMAAANGSNGLLLETEIMRYKGAATRLLGPSHVGLNFQTEVENAASHMADEAAFGPNELARYKSSTLSQCSNIWKTNQSMIDNAKLLKQEDYPGLIPSSPRQPMFPVGTKYFAEVSCSFGNNDLSVVSCINGTNLKVRTAKMAEIYQAYNVLSAGMLRGARLIIPLEEHFELSAQNGQKVLVLGVTIRDMNGNVVFVDKATQYGVIRVEN